MLFSKDIIKIAPYFKLITAILLQLLQTYNFSQIWVDSGIKYTLELKYLCGMRGIFNKLCVIRNIYFDSDFFWRMQLMIIKG